MLAASRDLEVHGIPLGDEAGVGGRAGEVLGLGPRECLPRSHVSGVTGADQALVVSVSHRDVRRELAHDPALGPDQDEALGGPGQRGQGADRRLPQRSRQSHHDRRVAVDAGSAQVVLATNDDDVDALVRQHARHCLSAVVCRVVRVVRHGRAHRSAAPRHEQGREDHGPDHRRQDQPTAPCRVAGREWLAAGGRLPAGCGQVGVVPHGGAHWCGPWRPNSTATGPAGWASGVTAGRSGRASRRDSHVARACLASGSVAA